MGMGRVAVVKREILTSLSASNRSLSLRYFYSVAYESSLPLVECEREVCLSRIEGARAWASSGCMSDLRRESCSTKMLVNNYWFAAIQGLDVPV